MLASDQNGVSGRIHAICCPREISFIFLARGSELDWEAGHIHVILNVN